MKLLFMVTLLLMGLGCVSQRDWGREVVELPEPSRTVLDGDGAVHLGFEIERALQPGHGGWHWLELTAAQSRRALTPTPEGDMIRFREEPAAGPLTPGLLEPGLALGDPPPGAGSVLTELELYWVRRTGSMMVVPPGVSGLSDEPGALQTARLNFDHYPVAVYQSRDDAQRQARAKQFEDLLEPFVAIRNLVMLPFIMHELSESIGP